MYLVTGSTGFIGGALCRALVERGERVRAFHRPTSDLSLLQGLEDRLEHAVGDVTDLDSLRRAARGVEVVFHTAALLGASRDPRQMYSITVEGTRNLLQAAGEASVRRVVHTSSVAALGVPGLLRRASSPILLDETHTWNYQPEWWPYGYAKYLAELEVQKAVARGFEVLVVNPSIVLGAGDIHQISGGIVIQMAQRGIPVAVEGGLNVIHICDVVRGHLAALERGQAGERYILAGENLTISGFLATMADVTGARPPRLVLPGATVRPLAAPLGLLARWLNLPVGDVLLRKAGMYFYYDAQKAKRELGLGEVRSTKEAIRDAYEWYMERGEIR